MSAAKTEHENKPVTVTCSVCEQPAKVLAESAWAKSQTCTRCWQKANPGADARYRAVL